MCWAVGLVGLSFLQFGVHADGGTAYHLDLDVYRSAALRFAEGHTIYAEPYTVGPYAVALPFTYPPLAALLFQPLGWVSNDVAGVIWTVACYAMLPLLVYVMARAQGWQRRRALVMAAMGGATLCWLAPVAAHLSLGQVNLFLMALVLVDLLLPRTPWPRGVLVGLAIAIKLTPAVFLVYFLLKRDVRGAATTLVSACLWTALGAVFAWRDSVTYWTTMLDREGQVRALPAVQNWSLRGVVEHLPLVPLHNGIWVLFALVAVCVAVVAMRTQLQDGQDLAAIGVNALLMLLISPVSWDHHYVWVIPILTAFGLAGARGAIPMRAALILGLVVFTISIPETSNPPMWVLRVLWAASTIALLVFTAVEARVDRSPVRGLDGPPQALIPRRERTTAEALAGSPTAVVE